jgi:hypothetical protein
LALAEDWPTAKEAMARKMACMRMMEERSWFIMPNADDGGLFGLICRGKVDTGDVVMDFKRRGWSEIFRIARGEEKYIEILRDSCKDNIDI